MRLDRIVVGVDGSEAGFEALRQAVAVLAPGGRIVAVSADDPAPALPAGWDAASLTAHLREEAEAARARAARELRDLGDAEARVVTGDPFGALTATAEEERASLIAVGSHGGGRLAGIVLGSVATALVRGAPCPVLLARSRSGDAFAGGVAVGLDGSEPSVEAEELARELSAQLSLPLRAIVATGGKPPSIERLRSVDGIDWDERDPVEALVAASHQAGLVVVGSRGLHGLAALGSVSERVAHEAECSVLVVRRPNWQARDGDLVANAVAG